MNDPWVTLYLNYFKGEYKMLNCENCQTGKIRAKEIAIAEAEAAAVKSPENPEGRRMITKAEIGIPSQQCMCCYDSEEKRILKELGCDRYTG